MSPSVWSLEVQDPAKCPKCTLLHADVLFCTLERARSCVLLLTSQARMCLRQCVTCHAHI
eukprot:1142103-Pelagomonas_calceolata.AAC.8